MLPERESRPAANRAASEISTPIKTPSSVGDGVCDFVDHDSGVACAAHGCPDCQALEETAPYVDPCATCEHLRHVAWIVAVDGWPGWVCELEDCLHCSSCGLCSKSGTVCRNCSLCVQHQDDGTSPCTQTIWSKARGREVEFYVHSLLDPKTGLWE